MPVSMPALAPRGITALPVGRRAISATAPSRHAVQHQRHAHLRAATSEHQQPQQQQHVQTRFMNAVDRHASAASSGTKHALILSSTTSAAAAADATLPTAFARVLVGAALALSTVYALLSSPASSATGIAFAPGTQSSSTSSDVDSSASATTSAPAFSSLPVLRTPEQFDAFVLASNRAGYLAVVLFHAPWCAASSRMEKELQRLSHLFTGRRVVFARVDCSIKQGIRPGQPLGQSQSLGFRLQRCDLTQLHRIHKTPTVRMYFHNSCVDEIIGCRPIDFRQATSDITFKYNL